METNQIEEYILGERAYREFNFSEAIEYLTKAVAKAPTKYAFFYLGDSLVRKNNSEKAIEIFQKTRSILNKGEEKDEILILQCIGEQEIILNHFESAKQYFEKAIELSKKYNSKKDHMALQAEIDIDMRQIQSVEENVRHMQYLELFQLAQELLKSGDCPNATEAFLKAAAIKATPECLLALAKCQQEQKEFSSAIDSYQRAIDLQRRNHQYEDSFTLQCMLSKAICFAEEDELSKSLDLLDITLKNSKFLPDKSLFKKIKAIHWQTKMRIQKMEEIRKIAPEKESRSKEEITSEASRTKEIIQNLPEYYKSEKIWHIVSKKWFEKYSKYVENPEDSSIYPGPIFNGDIILFESTLHDPVEKNTVYPIKQDMQEAKDFLVIPTVLWDLWSKTYGGLDLPRAIRDKSRVEIFLKRLKLAFKPTLPYVPNCTKILYESKSEKLAKVLGLCRRVIDKKANKREIKLGELKLRAWKILDSDLEDVDLSLRRARNCCSPAKITGTLVDPEKTIEEIGIEDNVILLIEVQVNGEIEAFIQRNIVIPRIHELENGNLH